MTSRRGISRAEQKRRRGRPVEENDRLTPTFRRAKSFATLDGWPFLSAARPYIHRLFHPLNTLYLEHSSCKKWRTMRKHYVRLST